MERVAVVGPGGAGKSTFAARLGQRTGLPVIHLDRHFWKPGWVETPPDEWVACQQELVRGDRWIIDGNYGGTFDVRFARADTVVVLAPPALSCVLSALRRSVRNRGVASASTTRSFDGSGATTETAGPGSTRRWHGTATISRSSS